MTQKEYKDLLLKDICGRLPYGLKGKCVDASYDTFCEMIFQTPKFDAILEGIKGDLLFVTPLIEDKDEQEFANEEVADGIDILDFKPYLRPICDAKSLMSEREWLCLSDEHLIEWYHAHHIDYRGLIVAGLAIPVTKKRNPYKD